MDNDVLVCPECGKPFKVCELCLAYGHFATVGYLRDGQTHSLCEACASAIIAYDSPTRSTILRHARNNTLPLDETITGPARWETKLIS